MFETRIIHVGLFCLASLLPAGQLRAAEPLAFSPEVAGVLNESYPRGVGDLREIEKQVQLVAAQAVPATVEVEVGRNIGSGVIVSKEGLVLTAAHVIGRAGRPATLVLADGRRLKGRTLGAHHLMDAGMVQITDPPEDLPFAPLAQDESMEVGQWVVATGQPGGILDDRSPPVRLGRVLATGGQWICTDCTLVGGDSGGPLFNMHGEVMAIHMSIGPEVVHNFHVPVTEIRPVWEKMLSGKVWGGDVAKQKTDSGRAVLGLAGRTVGDRCEVTQVFTGYPAQGAGILPGDQIVAVDGQAIDSIIELTKLVFSKSPGDTIRLEIFRNLRPLEIDVVLSAIRDPLPGSLDPASGEEEQEQP
ncbi:S1C family serine protease [Bythopirellula polymerisocia]|uniref:Putative serine protease HhoA n=1 Tax=Bythopirellula polymerisocia TaxID=2528003 RepID=A0A5C6CJZ3_9BACT|nr:trypsin-like peptidase domain-containing protein [Bythopirellula polymerisocia]TWU23611.1 putative serine protease HhoA precursor [Bythopirellula polymerisocia]